MLSNEHGNTVDKFNNNWSNEHKAKSLEREMQGIQPSDIIVWYLLDEFDLICYLYEFDEELPHTATLLPKKLQAKQRSFKKELIAKHVHYFTLFDLKQL